MILNEQQKDLLDRYLRNEMSAADRTQWDQLMKDEEFQAEVRSMARLKEGITQEGRKRLRAELRTWDRMYGNKKPAARRESLKPWRWIAAAILFIGIVSVLLLRESEADAGKLFARYFEPYPNVVAPIQKSGETAEPVAQAFQLYERGHYQEAYDAFQILPKNNPSIVFYMGLSQIELGDDEGARAMLMTLNMIPGHPYRNAADWYLALLEMKSGSIEKAVLMLDLIASSDAHPYRSKAARLRDKLEHVQ